jgi:hypothetical protein
MRADVRHFRLSPGPADPYGPVENNFTEVPEGKP